MVGIKLIYETRKDKHVLGGTRLVWNGNVYLTFAHERLALMSQADFDGCMGKGLQQWNRGACTRVKLADTEMSKPSAHTRARRGLDYGTPRYDADADLWQSVDPPTDRSKHFDPQWKELDMQME